MENISLVAIDLAKNTFWVHCENRAGKTVMSKKVSRSKLVAVMENLPRCTVVVEACRSAHYWSQQFARMGFSPKIIPTQHVKPFVGTQKNDKNDARAIAEASKRASVRFVPVKSPKQQVECARLTIRSRLIRQRTALASEIRAVLSEFGVVAPVGIRHIRRNFGCLMAKHEEKLGRELTLMILELHSEFLALDERVEKIDRLIERKVKSSEVAQRLLKVPGVGPIAAYTLITHVDPHQFKNGRHFAAYCGLVPKQHSTGGKTKLGGITKAGNRELRRVLVLAAKPAICLYAKRGTPMGVWATELRKRSCFGKAAVAYANKISRVIWYLLKHDDAVYDESLAFG